MPATTVLVTEEMPSSVSRHHSVPNHEQDIEYMFYYSPPTSSSAREVHSWSSEWSSSLPLDFTSASNSGPSPTPSPPSSTSLSPPPERRCSLQDRRNGGTPRSLVPTLSSTAQDIISTSLTPTTTLCFILETFQCNISQEQAWALIYQSVRALNQLITEYERNEHLSELSIGRLTSFLNIIIDFNGNVTTSTWTSSGCGSDAVVANGSHKETTCNLMKSEDKRLMNESINAVIASLATVIYEALEWNWKNSPCYNRNKDNLTSNDEELDLEENLENLMLSMFRCPEEVEIDCKNFVDEGYIDLGHEENCIYLVLDKCKSHFNELVIAEKKSGSILEMLLNEKRPVDADLYYQTVVRLMVDEAFKLSKLLDQLDDNRNNNKQLSTHHLSTQSVDKSVDTENLKLWAQTWIKVMSELRFGVHLRPSVRDESRSRLREDDKVVFNQMIRSRRENLRKTTSILRSISMPETRPMPVISAHMIQEKLQSLKPALERSLTPMVPKSPCLHERLMTEIRAGNPSLKPVKTVEKPSKETVNNLYLKERRWRKTSVRPQSAIYVSTSRQYIDSEEEEDCRCECSPGRPPGPSESTNPLKRFGSMIVKRKNLSESSPESANLSQSMANLDRGAKRSIRKKQRASLSMFNDTESVGSLNGFGATTRLWQTSTPKALSAVSLSHLKPYSNGVDRHLPRHGIIKVSNQLLATPYLSPYSPKQSMLESSAECICSPTQNVPTDSTIGLFRPNSYLRRSYVKKPTAYQQQQQQRLKHLNSVSIDQLNLTSKSSTFERSSNSFNRKSLRTSISNIWSRLFSSDRSKSSIKVKEE